MRRGENVLKKLTVMYIQKSDSFSNVRFTHFFFFFENTKNPFDKRFLITLFKFYKNIYK